MISTGPKDKDSSVRFLIRLMLCCSSGSNFIHRDIWGMPKVAFRWLPLGSAIGTQLAGAREPESSSAPNSCPLHPQPGADLIRILLNLKTIFSDLGEIYHHVSFRECVCAGALVHVCVCACMCVHTCTLM